MNRPIWLLNLALCGAWTFALTSCKPLAEVTAAANQQTSEQVAAASQSFGMLLDASVESALGQATAGGSARGLMSAAPDLRRVPTSTTFELATLTIGNRLVFPAGSASGSITLTLSGDAAVSWPAGSVTLYDGSVAVALHDIVLSNANGDRLRIPSGTFSYDLQAHSTVSDATNWELTASVNAAVNPPLAAFLDRQGRTWSLAMSGARSMHQVTTRHQTRDGSNQILSDTRQVVRTIAGATPGNEVTTDAALAGYAYARWSVTLGEVPVVWSRNAEITTLTNLIDGTVQTTVGRDATFVATTITSRTITIGPFSARQLGSLLGATLDPNWL